MRERQYGHIEQSGKRARAHFTVLELGIVICGGLHEERRDAEAEKARLKKSKSTVVYLDKGNIYAADKTLYVHGFDDGTHGSTKIK